MSSHRPSPFILHFIHFGAHYKHPLVSSNCPQWWVSTSNDFMTSSGIGFHWQYAHLWEFIASPQAVNHPPQEKTRLDTGWSAGPQLITAGSEENHPLPAFTSTPCNACAVVTFKGRWTAWPRTHWSPQAFIECQHWLQYRLPEGWECQSLFRDSHTISLPALT